MWLSLVCALLAFASNTVAQDSSGSFSLDGWQLTGAESLVAAGETLALPAGAQLSRMAASDTASIRMVSRPYFSAQPEAWPSLEVGPASLTFVRDEAGGAMVLLGDEPLALPFVIELDQENRSRLPLDFTLGYDAPRGLGMFSIEERSFSVPAASPGTALEIALSAGALADWPLETLEVYPEVPVSEPTVSTDATGPEPAGDGPSTEVSLIDRKAELAARVAEQIQARSEAMELFKAKDHAGGEETLLRANRQEPGSFGWHFESGGRLMHMALRLRQHYDYRGALAVARRALAHLQEAEKLGPQADARQRAQVHEVAGLINEELLRDAATARAEYEKALSIAAHSDRAREGLERLDEAQARSARVAARNGATAGGAQP